MKAITLQEYKRRILRVLVHIQEHLEQDLRMEELARLACFSPYHFHRVFKGMVGEPLKEHVRRLRLERAASQLRLSDVSVLRIALEAGYESHEAFTRSFRAAFGLSPSGFRSRKRFPELAPVSSGIHFAGGKNVKFRIMKTNDKRFDVQVKWLDPLKVAFRRHVGPYAEVGATWDQLLPFLGKEGLLGGDSLFIGLCHDDPEVTPEHKIRYDACVSVPAGFTPVGEIGVQIIAGGPYAVATHFGPYQKLGETYAKLMGQWLPRSGRSLRLSSCFESYLNDPQTTEPAELITDVYVPLEPLSEEASQYPPRTEAHHENHKNTKSKTRPVSAPQSGLRGR